MVEVEVPKQLSRAAREVLAVIAWEQPITLAQIDEWRGRRTGGSVMRRLEDEGLIAVGAYLQEPGNPAAWVTTEEFLRRLDLDSLEDLPDPEEWAGFGANTPDSQGAEESETRNADIAASTGSVSDRDRTPGSPVDGETG